MSQDIVFTLMVRITGNRELAGTLTVELFCDLLRGVPAYESGSGMVVAWIMNAARAKALTGVSAEVQPASNPGTAELPVADVLQPPAELEQRLRECLAGDHGLTMREPATWHEPEWSQVGDGILYKMLSTDSRGQRVGMLVRLVPGASYPPHSHAGDEELHLLAGELWIDSRKLVPGEYNFGAPGASDERVWSETGCTCVLITSTQDPLQ